jgi:hypothetical protein
VDGTADLFQVAGGSLAFLDKYLTYEDAVEAVKKLLRELHTRSAAAKKQIKAMDATSNFSFGFARATVPMGAFMFGASICSGATHAHGERILVKAI